MKIAFTTIHRRLYTRDRMFVNSSCVLGENVLMPTIRLKEELNRLGHEVHTIDMYSEKDYDLVLFQDIQYEDSLLNLHRPEKYAKYLLKRKWRWDYLYQAVKQLPPERLILQILEPPIIDPKSYDKRYHQYFGKILTWNDSLVDGKKYVKYCIPQYWSGNFCYTEYESKKNFVIIASNKKSAYQNELYSERRKVIEYFEKKIENCDFDLYGFGWKTENLKNYKGEVQKKLETLSQYKFCFCFENMKNISGYITEKIFDCFYTGCIPIYWGADNIEKYIPSGLFIDMRKFDSIDAVIAYSKTITKQDYMKYIRRTKEFLNSPQFSELFSVDRYATLMVKELITENH